MSPDVRRQLIKAKQQCHKLEIMYEDRLGVLSKRTVTIRSLDFQQGLLLAFCHTKQHIRTFRIDNILAAQMIRIKKQQNGEAIYQP